MTIMFAGGMTIAIPGETPVAVAQTGMLSVSATAAPGNSFGGPQIIEIVVDDPARSDIKAEISSPDVTIDGDDVTMIQADTGKWYAYISSKTALPTEGILALGDKQPDKSTRDQDDYAITAIPFDDNSDIVVAYGGETIILHYEEDLDSLAAVSTDRIGVPINGQVHVTVSDFRLNLNPLEEDTWVMYANGTAAQYGGDGKAAIAVNWVETFGGNGGEFTITADDGVVAITTNTDIPLVVLTETGANTGVFTSENDDDLSNIVATGNENDDFIIKYADSDVQVFIEDFDSTLEVIADGTWNSGESLTVRLTNGNLNTNTLTEQDMAINGNFLPVLIQGDPITLKGLNPNSVTSLGNDGNSVAPSVPSGTIRVNSDTHVGTLNILDSGGGDEVITAEFQLKLTENEVKQIDRGASYIQYAGPAVTIAGFDGGNMSLGPTAPDDVGLTTADITNKADADGATITLAYNSSGVNSENRIVIFDIFTFGEGASDAIYRALLEETDSASGVFEGTIEYEMLNQRTVNEAATHNNVDAVGDELVMILDTGYTGSDAPEFTYDGDNASEDAPTNTGEVSIDASTYGVSDDVTITLTDADLNTDSGAREIYRIANSNGTIKPIIANIVIGDLKCASEIGDVSLRETVSDSGIFEGSFEVPAECGTGDNPPLTTGESITVTYADFRDETGGDSEWTDSATIGADTGSVGLDRTVYPIPTAADGDIEATQVTITVAVDDSDVDTSSSSTQTIEDGVTLTVAGVEIDLGLLKETEPDSGIFESTVTVDSHANRDNTNDNNRIEQGDIITVRYIDESDASGNENSVSDSATFDLRNAVLTSDKSVYVIGQDALLTLIEADLNLDSGTIDNVDLERINWDSEAYDGSLADARADLGPVPTNLRETGENTGIFQVVITISKSIGNNALERGEEITLTYLDRGPSGADYVGDDERDVELQIETSNFGATVELDQNVYTWTDKVFITIVASDYNFDSNIVDEIGTPDKGEIIIRTRADEVKYRLAETGPDTGVFTGELVLTGDKDALDEGGPQGISSKGLAGPTDGKIKTRISDGISMSFAYSDSEAPLVASALIRWNVGEVQWLEASYAATGSGVVRIIDPDMNINPDAVDSIDAVVYSDTFIGGIELTLTETQEASGIFEGTVEFDPESASDGHRLQVTEGDIITASYEDETLPKPDNRDTLEITATTLIGSIVPPLARAPASNTAIVDAFGNSLASVSVDQQVQITADLTSGQDREQDFAYLVQIQNEDEVTVQLTWLAGTLGGGATFSAAQSWTPSETGSYTATIFVWESVNNPTALSPQLSITIDVV